MAPVKGLETPVNATQQRVRSLGTKRVAVGSWRGAGSGVLTGAKLFPVPHKSRTLIMPFGKLMLMEGFSVLLKWLEKPPHTLRVATKQTWIIAT